MKIEFDSFEELLLAYERLSRFIESHAKTLENDRKEKERKSNE